MNIFLDSFSKDALDSHNKYRAMHQAPSVKWSRALAKEAEAWAQKLAKDNCLRNGDTDDGENLYAISGKTILKASEVVEKWYDGIRNYRFHRPGFQSDAGHFTQIVWKNTSEMGVAKAKSSDGKIFVVARYRPAGNVVNRFEQNVFPKKSESPKPTSTTRTFTSRIEERNSEPVRSEHSYERRHKPVRSEEVRTERYERSTDPFDRDRKKNFFKQFEDMEIGRDGDRSGGKTEKIIYNDGPGKTTVITKTYVSGGSGGPGGVRTARETRTIRSSDEDFGGRRGRKWEDDDNDLFKRDKDTNRTKWTERKDYSPSPSRSQDSRPASAPKSSNKIDKSFKDQCLSSHNKYRSMHSAPSMTWNDDIAKQAQWYAEKLARARSLQHSSKTDRGDVGENLAMFSGDYDNAGIRASDMWYEEVKNYNFSRKGYQGGTGHFTQMVWKASKELGIGRAQTSDGRCTYVVARYRPAGNVVNYMDENVSPRRR